MPGLTHVTRWPYELAGVGFGVLGTVFIGYGMYRHRELARALDRGEFSPPDDRVLVALTVAGVALGLLSLALVFVTD